MNSPLNQTGKKIQNYVFNYSDFLGAGNFSKCYKGYNQLTKEVVAIKIVELNSLKSKKLQQLLFQQIQILKKLNHPSVLKCFQIFTSNRNCYIITQLCNQGNLQNKLKIKRVFQQNQANPIIRDVYEGLIYLAQNNIVHRDLKSANIFLHNGRAKIADFGFAKQINHNFKDLNIGSPLYMAPQGILHNIYGPKTQVWALGILVYQLFHGSSPYVHCKTQDDLKKNVVIPLRWNQLRPDISQDIKQFILACLEVNQEKRASIQQLGNFAYIQRLKSRIQTYQQNKFDFRSPSRSVHLQNVSALQINRNNFQRTNNNFRQQNNNFRNRQLSKNNNERQVVYRSVNSRSNQLVANDRSNYQSPSRMMSTGQFNKFNLNGPNRSYNIINQNTGYLQNPMMTQIQGQNQNVFVNQNFNNMPILYQNQNSHENQVQYQNINNLNPNKSNNVIQPFHPFNPQNIDHIEKNNTNYQQGIPKSLKYQNSKQLPQNFNNQMYQSFQQMRRPITSYQSQNLNSPIYDNSTYNSTSVINFIPINQNVDNQVSNYNKQVLIVDKQISNRINKGININNRIKPFQEFNPNKPSVQKIKLKNLFPQQLSFKQSIFFIHYCRLIFKFLCFYRESKYFESTTYITMFKHIISILISLKQLCQNKKVIADGQKAHLKVKKFKQVTLQYIAKYKKQIQKNESYFQPELIQQNNMRQMQEKLRQLQQKLNKDINQMVSKNNMNSHEQSIIVLGHLCIVIYVSLQQIWKAFTNQNFKNLVQIKHIQNILNTPKQQFTISSYLNYRNKFII